METEGGNVSRCRLAYLATRHHVGVNGRPCSSKDRRALLSVESHNSFHYAKHQVKILSRGVPNSTKSRPWLYSFLGRSKGHEPLCRLSLIVDPTTLSPVDLSTRECANIVRQGNVRGSSREFASRKQLAALVHHWHQIWS